VSDAKLELQNCIRFWENALTEYQMVCELSSIVIIKQTIKYLKELQDGKTQKTAK
jgi:hypothetical protein